MPSRRGPSVPGESARRKSLGKAGEAVAGRFLESIGFRLLAANYRRPEGEIDIVAKKGRLLVFCEVKTQVGSWDPRESYTERQQRRLVEASRAFLAEFEDLLPAVFDCRYDLIVIGEAAGGGLEVKEHIADAIRPE